ncbi:MAG: DUF72 domain-containing protein [Chloroflexi bacterium]|nr:DUF72 domain-containing protein [Chloroflexota bacterium]
MKNNRSEENAARVALGTSSWIFDGWRGVFYPEKLPRDQQLAYYTSQFNTVEVNTSFYAIPQPTTLIKWVETAPPDFTFTLKFPQQISHQKRLVNCQQETLIFLDVLRSLGPAAGVSFLQLPPDFTRQREGKALASYVDWLAGQSHDLRLAVEVRASDLMTPAFARYLAERGMAFVLVDRVHTPDLYETWLELIQTQIAPVFCMLRWIGDDKNGPKEDNALVAPRDTQLDLWAQRLAQLHHSQVDIYGYMHNPYEGHSPASLRRLQERLAALIPLPAWVPPTSQTPEEPGQMTLF